MGALIGLSAGNQIALALSRRGAALPFHAVLGIHVAAAIVFGFIFFIIFPLLAKLGRFMAGFAEKRLAVIPTSDIVFGVIGLLVGLLLSFLLSMLYQQFEFPLLSNTLTLVTYILLSYLGIFVA